MLFIRKGDYVKAEQQLQKIASKSYSSVRHRFKMLIESLQHRKELSNQKKLSIVSISDPNELGLVVLRMGHFPKVKTIFREYRDSWITAPALQSDRYKALERLQGAITIVVPNSMEKKEGEGWVNPELFGCGFREQRIFPRSQFKGFPGPGPMALTQVATRPDKNTADNRIVFFRDFQLWFSTTQIEHDQLDDVFNNNIRSESLHKVYDNMFISSTGGHIGKVPRDFSIVGRLEIPFLYDPAEGNLFMELRTTSGSEFPYVIDAHRRLLGTNGLFALGPNAQIAQLRTGGAVWQFTFIPVSCLENDPIIKLEIISTAILVQGPVEEIQLHVKAIKRSGLGPNITERAKYTSLAPGVAKINHRGLITPVSPGASTVTVSFADPISGETFQESAVVETVYLKDIVSADSIESDELPNKLFYIPTNLSVYEKELKEN